MDEKLTPSQQRRGSALTCTDSSFVAALHQKFEARREGRTVYDRIADPRVAAILELAQPLPADNAEHVAACRRIEGPEP